MPKDCLNFLASQKSLNFDEFLPCFYLLILGYRCLVLGIFVIFSLKKCGSCLIVQFLCTVSYNFLLLIYSPDRCSSSMH